MRTVTVARVSDTRFRVLVSEGSRSTVHVVTVRSTDIERYAPGTDPERLVEASFEFLLEREPKESILAEFDLPVVERYFPEFPRVIGSLLR